MGLLVGDGVYIPFIISLFLSPLCLSLGGCCSCWCLSFNSLYNPAQYWISSLFLSSLVSYSLSLSASLLVSLLYIFTMMARELYHDDCYNESVGMYPTKVKHNVTVVLHYQWSLGYTSPSMTVTRGEEERKEAVSGWRVILVGCPSLPSSSTSSASPSVLAPYLGCLWVSNECPLHFHAPFFTSDGISSNYFDECKPPTAWQVCLALGELFSPTVREAASGVVNMVNWFVSFGITFAYQPLQVKETILAYIIILHGSYSPLI